MGNTERFLVLDAGTTAVKALVFSSDLVCMVEASRPTQTHTPRPGWAEQDAGEYAALAKAVLAEVAPHGPFVAAALTNQRETAVAWDRETGVPLAPMILWHDGRSSDALEVLAGRERDVRQVTGLVPSAYFSASKFAWLSEQVPAVRQAAATGRLAMGTVDSWLMAQLTSERRHQTDESNASRTLLFDIRNRQWDPELCTLFGVATEALPATRHSQSAFGMLQVSDSGISSPLCVVVGDQQASLAAAGTAPGTTTVTHGTGTFLIQALGDEFTLTDHAYTTLAPGRMRSQ